MQEMSTILHIPDTMSAWPWPRQINQHYEEVKAASDLWIQSFNVCKPSSQRAFERCDLGLLAALMYPSLNKAHLRVGCDLMNIVFVIDDYTDVQDATVCDKVADVVKHALHNVCEPRPDGEMIIGEIARQFWQPAAKLSRPGAQRRFLKYMSEYLDSMAVQAADRIYHTIDTIDVYMKLRRKTAGVPPSFFPIELELKVDITNDVFYHPVVAKLSSCAADLIILDNDIASYNKEQSAGDRHNIIAVAMRQFSVDYDGAISWVEKYHKQIEASFLDALTRLPSWGPEIDDELGKYIIGMATWARGNVCWSFEGGRYFGDKGLEVQRTHYVPLLRKIERGASAGNEAHDDDIVTPLIEM
ncbi:terpenoid synthase [Laetiporus sulphureus 93-53]|uniref:Terpene synthase n=1 Tax=Laetiporus sulphureus 93-53 TaxID=1314785 RepID=A0A165HX22_9APHY|nr:terpenoid synthase [Laetiporus sulphureus 93-53]KZT12302.1 terpenoid synthase [Laetiporus sulphureus 93-53]